MVTVVPSWVFWADAPHAAAAVRTVRARRDRAGETFMSGEHTDTVIRAGSVKDRTAAARNRAVTRNFEGFHDGLTVACSRRA
jgi:hypothetical protein